MEDSGPSHQGDPDGDPSASSDQVACRQFVELVTGYFEGTLDARTASQVREHIIECDWCTTYMDQFEMTIALLRELRQPAPEPPEALLAVLYARKRAGG